ncbi:hypothetical protein GCK32_018826 [Trichostrongylus colubriformis]|uniref:Uncharacterized protein n=1 Tax=Trichostrongylus colubriformis TaxID=6319 RepID=A0AAN8FWE5_TRICO
MEGQSVMKRSQKNRQEKLVSPTYEATSTGSAHVQVSALSSRWDHTTIKAIRLKHINLLK